MLYIYRVCFVCTNLIYFLDSETVSANKSKKWLFLVNPKSGPGKALSIFQQRVVPMLAEAGIEFKLIVTSMLITNTYSFSFVVICN